MRSAQLDRAGAAFDRGLSVAIALMLTLIILQVSPAAESKKKISKFANEPAAHKLYDQMLAQINSAKTLSFECKYHRESPGKFQSACTYKLQLKKPNFFRMEVTGVDGKQGGVLIGDGTNQWVYWPNGRPKWQYVVDSAEDERTRKTSFMKSRAPKGEHSIWHEARYLGAGMSYPILDMSLFHGHIDSIQKYFDGARSLGTEKIAGVDCEKIEVAHMDGQRSWTFWISKQDHLPRKLKEVIHISYDVITTEEWNSLTLNGEIADSLFSWRPPEGWEQWRLPSDEAGLVKIGTKAPDFELPSSEGTLIKLSSYRGKPVWICFWRVGCPPCREELPLLEKVYAKHKDQGLIVLAVNVADDKKLVLRFLRDKKITFPNIIDTSPAAEKIVYEQYGGGTVPMNYLIDSNGKVVDAWFGNSNHETRIPASLKKLGVTP